MKNDTDRAQRSLVLLEGMLIVLTVGMVSIGYLTYHDPMLFFGALMALIGTRLVLVGEH
ncbi:MAG: hypothetical protein HGB28_00475 [Oscillochloris sp.]|nr:hypothetical protein [Oscillochloris sp.]